MRSSGQYPEIRPTTAGVKPPRVSVPVAPNFTRVNNAGMTTLTPSLPLAKKTSPELRIERDRLSDRCDELRAAMRAGNPTATDAYNTDYPQLRAIRRELEVRVFGVAV